MSTISMSTSRRADPSLQSDVDHLILDYLTFAATKSQLDHLRGLISAHQKPGLLGSADYPVLLADDFLRMYDSLHALPNISAESRFRIRLFRFVKALQRWRSLLTDTLDGIGYLEEDSNGDYAALPIFKDDRSRERARQRYQRKHKSLLSLLPSFMALSASQLALQGNDAQITEVWMHLAADFMLHAALEHTIVFASTYADVKAKAFRWDFDWDSAAEEGSDEFMINAMFFDSETEATNDTWIKVRKEYEARMKLRSGNGIDFPQHAQALFIKSLSSANFETNLLVFLENLQNGLTTPMLLQVELARIDGLDRAQSQAFRDKIRGPGNIKGL